MLQLLRTFSERLQILLMRSRRSCLALLTKLWSVLYSTYNMDIKVLKYFRESFYVTKNSNHFGHDSKLGTLESLRMSRIKTFKNSRLRIAFETFTRPRLTIWKSVVAIVTSTSASGFNANLPKCNGTSRTCAPNRGCISTVTEATKKRRRKNEPKARSLPAFARIPSSVFQHRDIYGFRD